MPEGIINLKLENVTFEQVEHYRRIVHVLIGHGFLDAKNGSVILHFDPIGNLQKIETKKTSWHRKKHLDKFVDLNKNDTIEVIRSNPNS